MNYKKTNMLWTFIFWTFIFWTSWTSESIWICDVCAACVCDLQPVKALVEYSVELLSLSELVLALSLVPELVHQLALALSLALALALQALSRSMVKTSW